MSCSSRRLTPSRESLAEYLAYRQEVEHAAARVNDRWARGDWQPVVIDERDDYDRSVAGFRRYDVLFVNPVKDGLNLVAKEGPLVNERDGVLCLSPEAGAYDELGDAAVAVHPFDVSQSAAALHEALAMPDSERARARHFGRASSSRVTRRGAGSPSCSRTRPDRERERVEQLGERGRAVDDHVGRRGSRRALPPTRHRCARRARACPTRTRSTSAANAGRSPASSPANAATVIPAASSSTTVPLSTGTGGRSSTAMRPRWGASIP